MNNEINYKKRIIIKSVICIIISSIAIIIGIFTNALRHKFLIDSKIIYVFIVLFFIFSISSIIIFNKINIKKKIYDILDTALYIGDILAFFFIVATTIISPIRVSGDSMNPTLKSGDIIFVSKMKGVKRNEIVVFQLSDKNLNELNDEFASEIKDELLVKRVVAVENDYVKVLGNVLYVNDEVVEAGCYKACFLNELQDGKIPKGYILVLGDNRDVSTDSRYFGLVSLDDVMGIK